MSPLRPWEWARLAGDDAVWWIRAVETRTAVAAGIAAARGERAGWDRLTTAEVAEAG